MQRHELMQPDPEHVRDDGEGGHLFEFMVDYPFDDGVQSVSVWAHDFEDAERRLKAIQSSAEVVGKLYSAGEIASTSLN